VLRAIVLAMAGRDDDEGYEPGSLDIASGERDVAEIAVPPGLLNSKQERHPGREVNLITDDEREGS